MIAAVLIVYAIGFVLERPGTVRIEGSLYSYKTIQISHPPLNQSLTPQMVASGAEGGQTTGWVTETVESYKNATFTLRLHGGSPGGGLLEGTVKEPNGWVFSFAVSGLSVDPDPWRTRISPDGLYGIQWDRWTTVRLLARI